MSSDFMKKGTDLQYRGSAESQTLNLEQSWGTHSPWERRQARPPGFGLERPGGPALRVDSSVGAVWGAGRQAADSVSGLQQLTARRLGWARPEPIVGDHVHRPAAAGRSLRDPG